MARVLRRQLYTRGSRDSWQSYFEEIQQDCPLITDVDRVSTSEVQVYINSECSIRFYASGETNFQILTPNGNSYIYWFDTYVTLTSIYSNTLYYLQTHDNRYTPNGQRMLFIYEIASGRCIYGYDTTSYYYPASFRDIKNVAFTETGASSTYYKHGALIPYASTFDSIAYLDKDILLNGNIKGFTDTNFISCSNVPVDSVLSFNGANYYSVGENTLVRLNSNT